MYQDTAVRSIYVDPPSKVTGTAVRARWTYAGNGQVFGLAGTSTEADTYWPSLPRPGGPSAYDGGRSHSPLRGSPGFPPGSLLRRACLADRANQLPDQSRGTDGYADTAVHIPESVVGWLTVSPVAETRLPYGAWRVAAPGRTAVSGAL